jgi:hypothetical protein
MRRVSRLAPLSLELVELMGIEPSDLVNATLRPPGCATKDDPVALQAKRLDEG